MHLELETHRTLEQVRLFVEGSAGTAALAPQREAAYRHIGSVLARFGYWRLGKAERGLLRRYLQRTTGLSRAQLARLIARYLAQGELRDRRQRPAKPFVRRYTREDIVLLAETDEVHGRLSGPATRKLCERAWKVFGDVRFERLAGISNGHLYNLRQTCIYTRKYVAPQRTRPVAVALGERRRPRPQGRPGFLRVDSVHQGDRDKVKGVYHLNLVDEVTQYQYIGSCQKISERYLLPLLEALLQSFPFSVRGFHSDNGSEYVNHTVAALLQKLHVGEFTKSRPRRSNDNALVEAKNGAVVRKHLGYGHIPARHGGRLDSFNRTVLSPYLNYHRPCLFPSETVDAKGRVRKRYRQQDVMTPYEKLKSLPQAESYLRPGISFVMLDAEANALSDMAAARRLNEARDALFRQIRAAA